MAAKKPNVAGPDRLIYVMPGHWLAAAASAAHSWFKEMGPGGEHVIRALDTARSMGTASEFALSYQECHGLMRALVLELGEVTATGECTTSGDLAIQARAEALALLARGGRRG